MIYLLSIDSDDFDIQCHIYDTIEEASCTMIKWVVQESDIDLAELTHDYRYREALETNGGCIHCRKNYISYVYDESGTQYDLTVRETTNNYIVASCIESDFYIDIQEFSTYEEAREYFDKEVQGYKQMLGGVPMETYIEEKDCLGVIDEEEGCMIMKIFDLNHVNEVQNSV